MAIAFAAVTTAPSRLSYRMYSETGDNVEKINFFSPEFDGTELATALDQLDLLSNAEIRRIRVSTVFTASGQKNAPVHALQNLISAGLFLTFTQANTLDPDGPDFETQFVIPAYADILYDNGAINIAAIGAGATTSLPGRLRLLTDFLEDNLAKRLADGTLLVGGWTFTAAKSGFGTVTDVINGQ